MTEDEKPFLKIAAEEWVPYASLHIQPDGRIKMGGPMGYFIDIFSSMMNFNYEIVRPEGALWGGVHPNGSFKGMVGMLQRQEVEFALGPFFATADRERVADLSAPLYRDYFNIFMVRPKITSDVSGFLKPFTDEVWYLILASVISVCLVMAFLVAMEKKHFNVQYDQIFSRSVFWVIQTLSQESSHWQPSGTSSRFLVVTWFLASLVFMSSYSGILTAMLTLPKVTIPIDSVSDMLAQSSLPWRLEAGTMMVDYLRESKDDMKRQVFTRMAGTITSCWRARQDIVDGRYAAICDKSSMKKIMSWDFSTTGQCHTYISKEMVYTGGILTLVFKTNSTYLPAANRVIHSLLESGILNKWLNDQFANATECLRSPTADHGTTIEPLDVESFGGPFLVLVAGLCLALLAFVCEVAIYKYTDN